MQDISTSYDNLIQKLEAELEKPDVTWYKRSHIVKAITILQQSESEFNLSSRYDNFGVHNF